jgi:enoyl-CoA hydratase/carnithine racemase
LRRLQNPACALRAFVVVLCRRPDVTVNDCNQEQQREDAFMFTEIEYAVADHVATVTLNRPAQLNAWTATMGKEVRAAMERADTDDGVRVIVLTGAGRGFCAGADMNLLSGITKDGRASEESDPPFNKASRKDFQRKNTYFPAVSKPIIAAINGPCAGLGLVFAVFCDMRFASAGAVFTTAFARRGLIAEHGISWTLPRLVGISVATDLLLSARKVDAAEALRVGLVDRVFPAEELMSSALAYAKELAHLSSPRSLKVMKKQLWDAQMQTLDEAVEVADAEMVRSFGTEDFKEGVTHFLEKRPPAFTGR